MIIGTGIDIIELKRIKQTMEQQSRFVSRVLTERERAYYLQITSQRRKVEFLAGRFAAKEAFAKAAGTGIGSLGFHDMEVLADEQGAPIMTVTGYESYSIFVSISHSEAYAIAQAIIEGKE
ncbi:holo-ACP synthase [Virgibacillus sp. LDC-1]|uniref:holo-ACP synthase n=1 Tax=Virgibacillus sp. LDC-1 TaxID=3039856 RepID=UPI0024DE3E5F|nr:holo-ACP synthase [Virgibacillus sp. LDC-1]